jgi:hypothetical protein
MLLEGETIPVIVTLSATGLKPFSDFLGNRVGGRGLALHGVDVSIGLQRDTSKKGDVFSKPTFQLNDAVPQNRVQAIKAARRLAISYAAIQEHDAHDTVDGSAVASTIQRVALPAPSTDEEAF